MDIKERIVELESIREDYELYLEEKEISLREFEDWFCGYEIEMEDLEQKLFEMEIDKGEIYNV